MNIEKFTKNTLAAVQSAQSIALENGNQQIEQVHLLYALLLQENGLIGSLISAMGINSSALTNTLQTQISSLPKVSGADTYFSQTVVSAIEEGEKAASQMGDSYVSVEHIMLGLIRKPSPEMKNILKNSLALSFIALKKNALTFLLTVFIMGGFALLTFLFPYIMAVFWVFIPTGFVAFMIVFNCYPVIQKYVINPYYEQRGEISPEQAYTQTDGENLFEDMGGKEKPVEASKPSGKQESSAKPKKKGKVIS